MPSPIDSAIAQAEKLMGELEARHAQTKTEIISRAGSQIGVHVDGGTARGTLHPAVKEFAKLEARYTERLILASQAWETARAKLKPDGLYSEYLPFQQAVRANVVNALAWTDSILVELRKMVQAASEAGEIKGQLSERLEQVEERSANLSRVLSHSFVIWLPHRNPDNPQEIWSWKETMELPSFPSGGPHVAYVERVLEAIRDKVHEFYDEAGLLGSLGSSSGAHTGGDSTNLRDQIERFKGYATKVQQGCDTAAQKFSEHAKTLNQASRVAGRFISACDGAVDGIDVHAKAKKVLDQLESFANIPTDFASLENHRGRQQAVEGYSSILHLLGDGAECVGLGGFGKVLKKAADGLSGLSNLFLHRTEKGMRDNEYYNILQPMKNAPK